MNMIKISLSAFTALTLSGCVVLDTAPLPATGPGPFLTGGDLTFDEPAAAPDLRSQLAGRSLTVPAWTYFLRSDGTLTHESTFSGVQSSGTWTVNGNTLCLQHQGQNCGTVVINGNIATFSSVSGDRPVAYTLG